MKYFILLFISLALSSCTDEAVDLEQFMVDVSEFNIDTSALDDRQYVEVLGASGKITNEVEMNDFYNLVVVRSTETGDTVNVLTTAFSPFDINDPTTRFLKTTTFVGKLIGNNENIENLDLNNIEEKKFDRVFYDTDYLDLDVRRFPTIVGLLGDYKIEEW